MAIVASACTVEHGDRHLGESRDLTSLAGRFIANQPILAVPDLFWEADPVSRSWSFRGWANLVVHVDETWDGQPLRLRFVPEGPTTSMHFRTFFDQRRIGEAAVAAASGLAIEIPPDALSPGLHRLKLERVRSADGPDVGGILDCRFTVVEFDVGQQTHHLDPDRNGRYGLIRAFLEDGVTGASNERRGGMLVAGNQALRMRLTTADDAQAAFLVSTLDGPGARFSVEVGGARHDVTAGATVAAIRVPIEAGSHELRLAVDGADDGLYLWAAPFLHRARPQPAGPVVLVTLDTTRRDVLSVYGGPEETSPNIARLAARATVFDHAWSTSPWTLPSHASLFTGLYPTRHGAGVSDTRLDSRSPTLASLARAAGYRTAGFSGGALSASRWGLAQGFELFRDPDGFETPGDRQTDYVERFLGEHASEPFFLFVNYFDPHAMYRAPDGFESKFNVPALRTRLAEIPVWSGVAGGDSDAWRAVINGEVAPSLEAIEYLEAAYRAEVAFMDHQIGRLMSALEDRGLFHRATIILVADHGELLGEGGFFSHGCRLDPELTEVPLIIKWPGQSAPERDDRLVSQVDLYATVLAALGVTASPRDGLPIGLTERAAFDARSTIFMEEHENRIHPLFEHMMVAPHIYGLQRRDWRQLVWDGGSRCSEQGPGGWRDSQCRVTWQQRLEELAAIAALPVGTDLSAADVGLTKEMREHLEALGYIR
jgi:hypothetical protein